MNNKAEKIEGINFIRALCAVGIICHHYSTHSASSFKLFYTHAAGSWGDVFVTVFFILSGGMLYYNHAKINSLKEFYFKRFTSIFPAFYISFLFFYIENIFAHGEVFYLGAPWKLLLSLAGMDGYLNYAIPNYYILGEWFLGALILLYLLYPLLLLLINKLDLIFTIILFVILIWENFSSIFAIDPFRNLISCMFSFWMGMLLFKYRDILYKKSLIIISLIVFLLLYFVPIPFNGYILEHFMGAALFVLLYHAGAKIVKIKGVSSVINEIGRLSYPIFLLQHIIIGKILSFRNPVSGIKSMCLMVITILMTIIYAKALSVIAKSVTSSTLFQRAKAIFITKD